ncbi:MAG: hypothetical protein J6T20_06980 [Treponema sp.]|nr:hypothetical protein [Treponema sp.]
MKKAILTAAVIFLTAGLFAQAAFSGYSGGKINYATNEAQTQEYDPDLTLQAFFQGQFNFSQNMWGRLEFSLDTADFISSELFHETMAAFKIDELSLTFKSNSDSDANYFSVFMGIYDPIGSDVFLQRYFGIQPIASKITESWLGIAGSVLYPHFGIGIADVKRLMSAPITLGGYAYINHEDDLHYVFNTDFRFACVYRYFTFDFAGGVGLPISDNNKGQEAIAVIDKVLLHAGTTMLIGNNYTQGLFIQAGLFNIPVTKRNAITLSPDDIYLLIEPRLLLENAHVNLSFFSLPQDTVDQLIFVDDTLGVNLNIYGDSFSLGANRFTLGTNFSLSFTDKTFLDLAKPLELIKGDYNITMTPYMSTNFLNGELHTQFSIKFMKFVNARWYDAFTADIGYTAHF